MDCEVLVGNDFSEGEPEAHVRQLGRVGEAMATGRTPVSWGMDVVYEALFDVFNQRYIQRRTEHGRASEHALASIAWVLALR